MSRKIAPCSRCAERSAVARGLCKRCWHWADYHGTLADYERHARPVAETVEELRHLGLDDRLPIRPQLRALAPHMGMKLEALDRAWERHKKRTAA